MAKRSMFGERYCRRQNKTAQLPFVKRESFFPESEYRLIAPSDKNQDASFSLDIDVNSIRKN